MSSHISALFHNGTKKTKTNQHRRSAALTLYRGLFISGCGFFLLTCPPKWPGAVRTGSSASPPLCSSPSTQSWCLPSWGRTECPPDPFLVWSSNPRSQLRSQIKAGLFHGSKLSSSSVQVCTRQPLWRDSQEEEVVRLAVGGEQGSSKAS